MLTKVSSQILKVIQQAIHFYQATLSPDHGIIKPLFPSGVCRYTPTCSQYTITAINKHGWPGLAMAARRLSSCHPFSTGGHDPVV